ncbi:MAG: methionyl-tRNA formyltransferase [Candidatus Sungbacteria bacterium RIFCSPHIGHO2_01_FULL_50_25]|uniref:Methionyl-tRNA formyltransferase n=1 Tax=Candidatus Sungbacteria bacterium RIFCSPHIGHO2_01_FULL_50_25 TaxID=1802265 RepID=A0A1G2KAG1_9BACT|nr:MAG: methionyl-tRNA formyltransferase [Candidatus Sungbacteria bacterium RIFCSPHIGHO2_01_FULL_50_25]
MIKNSDSSKILFWGTSEFAIPSLDALIQAGYSISGVVTTPDKPAGRKQLLTPPPVKVLAESKKIPVYQPEILKSAGSTLELPEADLFVVAAYGKIIPKAIIGKPRLGALNIHPSLLPRWRGPSPIQFTILSGDAETGITIIEMDELMDHGPIVASSKFKMKNAKITYPKLHDALAGEGAKFLVETLPKWISGEIKPMPQDESKVTFSKILKKEDGRIDWKKAAEEIERQIRAFVPWPGSWTMWPQDDRQHRIRIDEAEAASEHAAHGSPGFVFQSAKNPLCIQTGKGALLVRRLTIEGSSSQNAETFLRGYKDAVGGAFI